MLRGETIPLSVNQIIVNKKFKEIYDALQEQREGIFNKVKDISPEKFNNIPVPGKWSISQILTHILTSERVSLSYMKKKSLGIDQVKNSGIVESIRLWLLIVSQRIPIKYKAPKVLVQNTPEALPLNELIQQWNIVRQDLISFLEAMNEKNTKKVIYKHPLAGRLDAYQAMVFFREHIIHHTPQIDRILKNPGV